MVVPPKFIRTVECPIQVDEKNGLEISKEFIILPNRLLVNTTEPQVAIDSPKKFLLFNKGLPCVHQ